MHGGVRAGRHMQQRRAVCASSEAANEAASFAISYDHLLLALLDGNPYLSAGSKQALATTAGLAVQNSSRITVLMVDAEEPAGDPAVRLENIQWHLREGGVTQEHSATFLEKALDKEATHNPSVALGDVADEVEADLLLLSSEAVHCKAVDANLLAEFSSNTRPCPRSLQPAWSMAKAVLVLAGLVLAATLGPCSAQHFFKPTGTPGAYGVITEGKPKFENLPKTNFTFPKMAKGAKGVLTTTPGASPMLPGLVLNLTGQLPAVNLSMLVANISAQCPPLQNLITGIQARVPTFSGLMLVGECPNNLHLHCSTCQVSLTSPSECVACYNPFVLNHDTKACGCAVGFKFFHDTASAQDTCVPGP
ncbi:hypothetical protein WJX81_003959 [Elliptochloris bilobata]|uniref:Uncharacterized protein n=1 Tax=Elliptochloris bilobata TaxID=381761 RepID=A0AAW1QIA0_9CHLO